MPFNRDSILSLVPHEARSSVEYELTKEQVEEIRFRPGRKIELITRRGRKLLDDFLFSSDDAVYVINQLSQHSVYAFEEELKHGYITLKGGHRVGLGGEAVVEAGKVKTLKHIRSFNIRISRSIHGVCEPYVDHLFHHGWNNILIAGPPQSGKTTLLRDVAKVASDGWKAKQIPPSKVAIVDERSEIAASFEGVPQFDIGERTDVLDRCPKAEMMMLVRSMSPDLIIVDEIGSDTDKVAIKEAIRAGVSILCTAHAKTFENLYDRDIFVRGLFDGIIMLDHDKRGTYYSGKEIHRALDWSARRSHIDDRRRV
ncbi:LOW QUALITY PROTEIN: stage III sporulation protein AA [Geomicrobium sp. JCM 19039]|nr:LOW QUALITY PROTEIN: stage III sporulation protein AA [Geomicrobium sp. JCM 19039]